MRHQHIGFGRRGGGQRDIDYLELALIEIGLGDQLVGERQALAGLGRLEREIGVPGIGARGFEARLDAVIGQPIVPAIALDLDQLAAPQRGPLSLTSVPKIVITNIFIRQGVDMNSLSFPNHRAS